MANFPPEAYEMRTGAWNTDAQENTSVFLSGDSSVELIQSTLQTSVMQSEYIEVAQTRHREWAINSTVQQYGGTGGTMYLIAEMYNASKVRVRTVTATSPIITVAGVWQDIGGFIDVQAGEQFMRPAFFKDVTNVGWYVDRLSCELVSAQGHAATGNWSQVIPTGAAWNVITQWGALRVRNWGYSIASGVVTPLYAGTMHAHTTICWDQTTAAVGDYYETRLKWFEPFTGAVRYAYANATPLAAVPAAGLPIRQTVGATFPIAPSGNVSVEVRQQTGGNRNVVCALTDVSPDWSSFHVAML